MCPFVYVCTLACTRLHTHFAVASLLLLLLLVWFRADAADAVAADNNEIVTRAHLNCLDCESACACTRTHARAKHVSTYEHNTTVRPLFWTLECELCANPACLRQ